MVAVLEKLGLRRAPQEVEMPPVPPEVVLRELAYKTTGPCIFFF